MLCRQAHRQTINEMLKAHLSITYLKHLSYGLHLKHLPLQVISTSHLARGPMGAS
jgi:accessory gene regulator protein AgrB